MDNREKIARWLFTFVRDRESLVLGWEEVKNYYLQEADSILSLIELPVVKLPPTKPVIIKGIEHYPDCEIPS